MHLLADRLPVAELIGLLVDRLDWRAVMASSHSRLWRNLDKLVDDAQVSELVNVNAFLEYLGVLREGEGRAVADAAGGGGGRRLRGMPSAKGVECGWGVVVDASRSSRQRSQCVYLMEEIGAAAAMDRVEDKPLVYRLARALDAKQSQAEEDRLLYVAATRARERLIISGHLSESRGSYKANGWMKETLELFDLDPKKLVDGAGSEMLLDLPGGERLRAWADPGSSPLEWVNKGTSTAWPDSAETPLFHVASVIQREQADSELDEEPERSWRATGLGRKAPATAAQQRERGPGQLGGSDTGTEQFEHPAGNEKEVGAVYKAILFRRFQTVINGLSFRAHPGNSDNIGLNEGKEIIQGDIPEGDRKIVEHSQQSQIEKQGSSIHGKWSVLWLCPVIQPWPVMAAKWPWPVTIVCERPIFDSAHDYDSAHIAGPHG